MIGGSRPLKTAEARQHSSHPIHFEREPDQRRRSLLSSFTYAAASLVLSAHRDQCYGTSARDPLEHLDHSLGRNP
jgi:hypothetical protein